MSEDPIGFDGGLNFYAYVNGMPTAVVDPMGLSGASMSWAEPTALQHAVGLAIVASGPIAKVGEPQTPTQQWVHDAIDSVSDTELLAMMPLNVLRPRHHLLPQRWDLAAFFKAAGLNIHDYTVAIRQKLHKFLHSAGARGGRWNREWEEFFRRNPNATRGTDSAKDARYDEEIRY